MAGLLMSLLLLTLCLLLELDMRRSSSPHSPRRLVWSVATICLSVMFGLRVILAPVGFAVSADLRALAGVGSVGLLGTGLMMVLTPIAVGLRARRLGLSAGMIAGSSLLAFLGATMAGVFLAITYSI